jgi:pilus assembly protein CpaF
MGFEVILPFVEPLAPYVLDSSVSEIMVNGNGTVYVERAGNIEWVGDHILDRKYLPVAIQHIARKMGKEIDESQPLLEARLHDGSRVAAVFPPCSVGGPQLSIRKFQHEFFSLEALVEGGSMPQAVADKLIQAIREHWNLVISGGTSSGKTTMLTALANCISEDERIGIIEDTSEIQIEAKNSFRFEAREEVGDAAAVSIRKLVRAALRHRPDRLIVGEVRGAEAYDLLQALNTGHGGSLTTIHANSADRAISKLVNLVLQANIGWPFLAIERYVADTVNCVIHLGRRNGRRLVTEVLRIEGHDGERVRSEPLWTW